MVSRLLKRLPPLRDQLRRSCSPATSSFVFLAISKSISTCHRRLLKLFAYFVHLGATTRRHGKRRGYRLLINSPPDVASPASPYPFPPPAVPGRRTVVLDLDETLVHSETDPVPEQFDFVVRKTVGGAPMSVYVVKRPGVDRFLEAARKGYELVVFTAGLEEYASMGLVRLDCGDAVSHRFYRQSCRVTDDKFVKDLSELGRDLGGMVIMDDNHPNAHSLHLENGAVSSGVCCSSSSSPASLTT